MPFVLRLSSSPRLGDVYYAGPVELQSQPASPAFIRAIAPRRPELPITSLIDQATRIPAIFAMAAETKRQELECMGVSSQTVYDLPKPVKWLGKLLF